MNLHLGQVLVLVAGIIQILQRDGLMDEKGNFRSPLPVEAIAQSATDINALLQTFGLHVDANLNHILVALPLLFEVAGLH